MSKEETEKLIKEVVEKFEFKKPSPEPTKEKGK